MWGQRLRIFSALKQVMLRHSLARTRAASRSVVVPSRAYRRLRAGTGSTADARDAALLKVQIRLL